MGFNKQRRNVTCNLLLSLKQEARSLIKAPGPRLRHGEQGVLAWGGQQGWPRGLRDGTVVTLGRAQASGQG